VGFAPCQEENRNNNWQRSALDWVFGGSELRRGGGTPWGASGRKTKSEKPLATPLSCAKSQNSKIVESINKGRETKMHCSSPKGQRLGQNIGRGGVMEYKRGEKVQTGQTCRKKTGQ